MGDLYLLPDRLCFVFVSSQSFVVVDCHCLCKYVHRGIAMSMTVHSAGKDNPSLHCNVVNEQITLLFLFACTMNSCSESSMRIGAV